jgi:Uncharacterized protein conserved in bacteria
MEYEIVYLNERNTAGIKIRTKNSDINMTKYIGALWERFFHNGVLASIPNKKTAGAFAVFN